MNKEIIDKFPFFSINKFPVKLNHLFFGLNMGFTFFHAAAKRGTWQEWGIKSWNDLTKLTFGEINRKQNFYTGKAGLERAQAELKLFEAKTGNLPRSTDPGMRGICGAVRRGAWKEQGIRSWKTLLEQTFV